MNKIGKGGGAFVVILIIVIAVAAFIYFKPLENQNTSGYDKTLNYKFDYPANWQTVVNVDNDVEKCDPTKIYDGYTCVDFPDSSIKKVITFTKEIEKDEANIISVDIEFTAKSGNLQQTTSQLKNELEASGLSNLNEKTISVDGVDGVDITAGTSGWKAREVIFSANSLVYTFKYSTQEEYYETYEGTFDKVVNSFKVN